FSFSESQTLILIMVMGEASRGSPSLQEGVLKAGWLKKQRSIMKNWQLHSTRTPSKLNDYPRTAC
uniref:Uncharacterized protein n=1 Tax=Sinocyclocheilus grahami TaxID=75366 RepID=A0A672KED6_SINGR